MDVNKSAVDPVAIFAEIEALKSLQLHEPRFGARMRAHFIGQHLAQKGLVPGRVWALPPNDDGVIASPLRDADDFRLRHIEVDDFYAALVLSEDSCRSLLWKNHVAACDISDRYNPVVYDPVLFSGPVSLWRWMAAFRNPYIRRFVPPVFVLCDWDASPFGPEPVNLKDEEFLAQMSLTAMHVQCSNKDIAYVRSSPAWPGEPPPPKFWIESD